MKKLILVILFATAIIGCSKSEEVVIIQPQNIIPILVLKGELYGAGAENILEQRTVISNSNDWNALITQMGSVNSIPSIPNVDFATEKVIAIFDKVQGNGGISIGISSIIENQNEIIVTVCKTEPEGFVTTVITQPLHVVKIPQTSKPIVFN